MSWLFVWFFIFLLLTLLWTWIFSKFKNPVLDLFILWHYSLQRYSLHLSSFDTRFVILAYSCLFHAFCDDSMRFALLVVCNICMYIYIYLCVRAKSLILHLTAWHFRPQKDHGWHQADLPGRGRHGRRETNEHFTPKAKGRTRRPPFWTTWWMDLFRFAVQ